jgi:hypothetical protein
MTDTIHRRMVLVEQNPHGVMRFQDWAMVVTSLGNMVEPFQMGVRNSPTVTEGDEFTDHDPEDEIRRIDGFMFIDQDALKVRLSGGEDDTPFHGGWQLPHSKTAR